MRTPPTPATSSHDELHVMVAGHTNTGKTSLLRTLGRTTAFGEVSASPSTTRQIQPMQLAGTGDLTVTVYDTPGLESAGRLRERLEAVPAQRHDPPAAVRGLLGESGGEHDFEQELRVLAKALDCDAVLYVIDARDPPFEKYLDEIAVLAMCGRPILPLLNFTSNEDSRAEQWRDELRKVGQHTVIEFDVAVYSWASELRLYRSLAIVLPRAEPLIERLIALRGEEVRWRTQAAVRALADALLDLAACEDAAPLHEHAALTAAAARVREYATERERRLGSDIRRVFNYSPEILGERLHDDFEAGQWKRGAFSDEALRYYGVRSMGPVAAGALTGGTWDVFSGGASLGAGTALGAAAGAAWGARDLVRRARRRLVQKLETVQVPDAVLRVVATRNLQLIAELERRGHGSPHPAGAAASGTAPVMRGMLPAPLMRARDHASWSDYRAPGAADRQPLTLASRDAAADRLRETLHEALTRLLAD